MGRRGEKDGERGKEEVKGKGQREGGGVRDRERRVKQGGLERGGR